MTTEEKTKNYISNNSEFDDCCIFEDEYGNPDWGYTKSFKDSTIKHNLIKSGFKSVKDATKWMHENLKPLWAIYDDRVQYTTGWHGVKGDPKFTRFGGWGDTKVYTVVESGIKTKEEARELRRKLQKEREDRKNRYD